MAAQSDLRRDLSRNIGGRIYAELEEGLDPDRIAGQLARVFGIRWYAPAARVERTVDDIEAAAVEEARAQYAGGAKTFKLEAERRDKRFPHSSYELCCRIGDTIRSEMPEFTAQLDDPDALINIEVRTNHGLVFGEKKRGLGGLPVRSTGRVLALISGGIDSPVAAWQLMRRGLEVECVYFASPPFTGSRAEQKARDLVAALSAYAPKPVPLHVCHFTEVQETIAEQIPEEFWTLLHRRFMQRIASELARRRRCGALATGDSIGQVASQTLRNMTAIDRATDDLVLRPLLSMDKQDIIELAREIGTYPVSTRPFEDCCVLFAPKSPATAAHPELVTDQEAKLDVDGLVNRAVERVELRPQEPARVP